MLKNHEKDMIKKALKYYKNYETTLGELDKIHITNLIERVNDLPVTKESKKCKNLHILNDKEMEGYCKDAGMIKPYVSDQQEKGVISFGQGSFGYDIRLGNEFEIFTPVANTPVDPKEFDKSALHHVESEDSIIIPPNSFALGYSKEKFNMPVDVFGLCVGKSTYARCGIIVNMTPIEPSWRGHLTIEISNTTPLPAKVYSGEGIAQVVFFRGNKPETTYSDKKGKYQDQGKGVQTAK